MNSSSFNEVAEITLLYKPTRQHTKQPQILCSQDAYNIFLNQWGDNLEFVEEFKILLLNNHGRVLGIVPISKGGLSSVIVDARLIFASALKACASSIILAHNHPSGNLTPSKADFKLTSKLRKAGEFLDITVNDHIIITPYEYYSFADEGQL